jgi:hypothetical protein
MDVCVSVYIVCREQERRCEALWDQKSSCSLNLKSEDFKSGCKHEGWYANDASEGGRSEEGKR